MQVLLGHDLDYWGADTNAEFARCPPVAAKRGTRAPVMER
jgi:hypothetical protein